MALTKAQKALLAKQAAEAALLAEEGVSSPVVNTPESITAVGDKQPKERTGQAGYFEAPVVTSADLTDINSSLNNPRKSGKTLGASVVTDDGVLMVATGNTPSASWVAGFATTTVNPTGTFKGSLSASIGDLQRVAKPLVVTSIMFPVVPKADLLNAAHPINLYHLSGKQLGACVCDETGKVYVAKDKFPTSVWAGLADLTPVVPEGGIPTHVKPSIGEFSMAVAGVQCHIGIPVVTGVELTDDNSFLNNRNESGKRLGLMAIRDTTAHLHISLGSGVGTGFKDQLGS